jgi:hypothetical protein
METLIIVVVAVVVFLFAGWHIAFLVKNFGSREARRLYETTH